MSGIYKIQSRTYPDKFYIGSALDVLSRQSRHLSELKHKRHPNKKLQNHYDKYGESDLLFSTILECPAEHLITREQDFINVLNPWFNICKIAGNSLGMKHSESSNQKNRERHIGRIPWNKGKKTGVKSLTQFKKGQSPVNKGVPMSEEQKEKLRTAWNRRRLIPVSEETRLKHKEWALKNNWMPPIPTKKPCNERYL